MEIDDVNIETQMYGVTGFSTDTEAEGPDKFESARVVAGKFNEELEALDLKPEDRIDEPEDYPPVIVYAGCVHEPVLDDDGPVTVYRIHISTEGEWWVESIGEVDEVMPDA